MAVLLATFKEGTAGPVFQLAEPVVALLSACGAAWAGRQLAACASLAPGRGTRDKSAADPGGAGGTPALPGQTVVPGPSRGVVLLTLALPVLWAGSLVALGAPDAAALGQSNAPQVARMVALVRAHARPGATIVAPPYFALRSGTRLPDDAADTYILAQRVRRRDPWALRWLRTVDGRLEARRVPIVLVDLRIAAIGPLMAALRAHYRPVYADRLPPALHVVAWLPDNDREWVMHTAPRAARRASPRR